MGSNFQFLQRTPAARTTPFDPQNPLDYLSAFGNSTLSGIGETFGLRPDPNVLAFRAQDPLLGAVSQLLPMVSTYAGWAKATTKIPVFANYLDKIGKGAAAVKAAKSAQGLPLTIGGSALKEIVRMAPLEATRLAVGTTIGERDFFDMAVGDVGTSLLFEGGVGAAIGTLSKLTNKGVGLEKILEGTGVDARGSYTEILRGLENKRQIITESAEAIDPNFLKTLDRYEESTRTAIKLEHIGLDKEGRIVPLVGKSLDTIPADATFGVSNFDEITSITQKQSENLRGYLDELQGINGRDLDRDSLLNLFVSDAQLARGEKSAMHSKLLTADHVDGLSTVDSVKIRTEALGMSENDFTKFTKFGRLIEQKAGPSNYMEELVRKNMNMTTDGYYWVREKDNGLFMMAKKLPKFSDETLESIGEIAKTDVDEWIVFKTDAPEAFAKKAAAFDEGIVRQNAFMNPEGKRVAGAAFYNDIYDQFYYGRLPDKALDFGDELNAAIKKDGLGAVKKAVAESTLTAGAKAVFQQQLTPTIWQLQSLPLGRKMIQSILFTDRRVKTLVNEIMVGTKVIDPTQKVGRQIFRGNLQTTGESVTSHLAGLNDAEWLQFNKNWEKMKSPELVNELLQSGAISTKTADFGQFLHKTNADLIAQRQATQTATGMTGFKEKFGHLLIGHNWKGNQRVFIKDSVGNVVEAVGGESQKLVDEAADVAMAALRDKGAKGFTRTEVMLADSNPKFLDSASSDTIYYAQSTGNPDAILAQKVMADLSKSKFKSPHFKAQKGVGGYQKEFTKEEFAEIVGRRVNESVREMGSQSVISTLSHQMDKLNRLGEFDVYNTVKRRLDDFNGVMRPGAKALNEVADKILGPWMGKDSATKVVRALNSAMIHLTLGMGRISYPAIAMMQHLQTGLPEIALIAANPTRAQMRLMGVALAPDKFGKVSRSFGTYEPMKVTMEAARLMANPSSDKAFVKYIDRMLGEGVIETTFMDSIDLSKGITFGWKGAKEAIQNNKTADYIGAMSSFGISSVERMTRAYSGAVGYIAATKLMGLKNFDDIYDVGRAFTERTMYNYTTLDKAGIFGGPLGSAFGLFKTWTTNYLHQSANIMAETGRNISATGFKTRNLSPLLWGAAGSTAVGGIAAAPIVALADGMSRLVSNKSLMEVIYDTFELEGATDEGFGHKDVLSDALYLGLPSLLGVTLTAQGSTPLSNPMRDVGQMFSFAMLNRMQGLTEAVATGADHVAATGDIAFLGSAKVRDQAMQALFPSSFYRTIAALGNDQGMIKSLKTGNPMFTNRPFHERLAFSLGFNPPKVERDFRIGNELWNDRVKRQKMVRSLGQAFAEAEKVGDSEGMNIIVQRARHMGILSEVTRSALTRKSRKDTGFLESRFSEEELLGRLDER